MNQTSNFEALSFDAAPAFQDEVFEAEDEWGRRGSFKRGGSGFSRPRTPQRMRPRGNQRPLYPTPHRHPQTIIHAPYDVASVGSEPSPSSERTRWVQDCLNHTLGMQLAVTGVMGPETRSAVRSFQRQQGLRMSGIAGPDTEAALRNACGSRAEPIPVEETEFDLFSASALPSENELPSEFQNYFQRLLDSLPATYRANWQTRACYRLPEALNHAPRSGGLYLLVWGPNASPSQRRGPIGYVGKATNLWERLRNYHWYARALGVDPRHYAVCFYPLPDARTRSSVELAHRNALRAAGLVTNQRELDVSLG